jgi:flagellar biosynthesis protein FlhA
MIQKSRASLINSELLMILFATGILLILFIPIPSFILDFLLIINFSWALTILLLTFYTDKPLSFSTFPALLLISTLFRLSLNISATRLILSDANAGRVINAIGQYVIHDNYVMGLVVFLILIIVQYVVVTNGAQRVAEVAARFTLDSMPGKQMSIDADLNMGIISQADATYRRSQIEKEANFYGAMDGASKFVKGDAIAGILILLVDIIGGFAIGMAQKGLSMTESIHTYSLLTVGDGLVTQIPALTISMATGIIVTRAATDAHLGREVAKQISAYPKSLWVVSASLLGLLFLRGIPVMPVMFILGLYIFASMKAKPSVTQDKNNNTEESLYDKIRIHPIEIQLNPALFDELSAQEDAFLERVALIREQLAFDLGFIMPEVVLRVDKSLAYPCYALNIQGSRMASGELYLDKVRAPLEVLSLHLKEIVLQNLAILLTRTQTERLLDQADIRHLRDELIPTLLPFAHVQRVLQNLLEEQVSIRFLPIILESLLENSKNLQDVNALTELVRNRLADFICQKLINPQRQLAVLTLSVPLEQSLFAGIHNQHLAMEPKITERFIVSLAKHVTTMVSDKRNPVLLCASPLRRHIKQLTLRVLPQLTVLSMNEIPVNIQVESYGVLGE